MGPGQRGCLSGQPFPRLLIETQVATNFIDCQRKCRKVMLSVVSVHHFVHRGGGPHVTITHYVIKLTVHGHQTWNLPQDQLCPPARDIWDYPWRPVQTSEGPPPPTNQTVQIYYWNAVVRFAFSSGMHNVFCSRKLYQPFLNVCLSFCRVSCRFLDYYKVWSLTFSDRYCFCNGFPTCDPTRYNITKGEDWLLRNDGSGVGARVVKLHEYFWTQ